ncbi:MAG TPA: biopolymer transporter ExbD [Elusimicrobiota bacterium]|nr:biopolymer transporter ExbD [Elusimicrobiota bacterium]
MENPLNNEDDLDETQKINIVPLADVTLVLLIVLMVLSPMISNSMINVSTPQIKADKNIEQPKEEPAKKPPEPLIISVTNGGYTLNNVPVRDEAQLMEALRARLSDDPDRPVLVSADPDIKVGAVVHILDTAKQNGAQKVSLLKKAASPTETDE